MSNITAKPLKPKEVDVSNITFGNMKTMPSGAKVVYLNYSGNMLFLQSPEMNINYDTGTYYPENDNSGKYSIRASMDNIAGNESMKEFHRLVEDMDKYLISQGVECSSEWFKSQPWFKKKGNVADKVADNYTPMVKVSIDSETGEPSTKWAPAFAFKIVKREGNTLCDCYDSDKNKLNVDTDENVNLENMFKKGSKVKMILRCNGLWVSNVGWGCTWRAEQIKINTPLGFSGYAFDSDEEDEGVPLSRQDSVPASKLDNQVESDDETDDSDDDDVQEESAVVKRKKK